MGGASAFGPGVGERASRIPAGTRSPQMISSQGLSVVPARLALLRRRMAVAWKTSNLFTLPRNAGCTVDTGIVCRVFSGCATRATERFFMRSQKIARISGFTTCGGSSSAPLPRFAKLLKPIEELGHRASSTSMFRAEGNFGAGGSSGIQRAARQMREKSKHGLITTGRHNGKL